MRAIISRADVSRADQCSGWPQVSQVPQVLRAIPGLGATALTVLLIFAGCTTKTDDTAKPTAPATPAVAKEYNLEIPMVEYQWDPQAGDPSVSAELGGPGFTGEGWQTNMKFPAMGNAGAPQGGRMTTNMYDWPATLRQAGKDWNDYINYFINGLCYEGLVGIHPITLEFIPALATHWWISEDRKMYRYRLNPKARWSDGKEVTAEDVIASYRLRMDETILFPMTRVQLARFEEPVAKSKYILEVTVKEDKWRNFLTFSGMSVFPAHEVSISGTEYLDKYEFAYTANSGPYIVKLENIIRGKSISVTRRKDWWDGENPAWRGLWNIGEFKWIVVKDPNLAFEKVKKGEIDYYVIPKAQWWAEELDKVAAVQRGLLLKRKFFTNAPVGFSGIAINMKRPPLDDLRIRKALAYLMDRDTMIEKLFYNEYKSLNSYYQSSDYQSPNNVMTPYDELAAVELLEEAGWAETNEQGIRVKNGKQLQFTLTYDSALSERHLTVFQEACKRAGIALDLQRLTRATRWKNVTGKEYELTSTAWGASMFPDPENNLHSKFADQLHNNNITSFADPKVDALIEAYGAEYNLQKRIEFLREIDGLVFNAHPYVLHWYNPSQRVVFWNKFGMPEFGGLRSHDQTELPYCWWVDPEKEKRLEEARKDESIVLPKGEAENHFWAAWNRAREKQREKSTETNPGS